MARDAGVRETEVYADGAPVADGILRDVRPGAEYRVLVKLPAVN